MKTVGVVIPCFNHWHYLDECLTSLAAQTYPAWEAVVVDDGSVPVPEMAKVKRRWTDAPVRWVAHEQSRGPGPARNSGFRATECEYVLTLDADDFLRPEYLARLVPKLDANPSLDCVFPDFKFFGEKPVIWTFEMHPDSELARSQFLPAQVLMRRSLWERVGGYCEHPELRAGNEDWDFWITAAERGFKAERVPEPLYCYRQAPTSTTRKLAAVDYRTRELIYARHSAFIDRHLGRRRFLGDGYWRSAAALRDRRSFGKALALSVRALFADPDPAAFFHMSRTIVSAAIPPWLRSALRGKQTVATPSSP